MCTGDVVWGYGELRKRGLSRQSIKMGLVTGALLHLRRGVYASADACASVIAAALHGGSIGCATAARHHGLWVLEDSTVHTWIGHDGHGSLTRFPGHLS